MTKSLPWLVVCALGVAAGCTDESADDRVSLLPSGYPSGTSGGTGAVGVPTSGTPASGANAAVTSGPDGSFADAGATTGSTDGLPTTGGDTAETADGGPMDASHAEATVADGGHASCGVPSSFRWTSTGPLIGPASSSHASLKDPTVVFDGEAWMVHATVASTAGQYDSVVFRFDDWAAASTATQHPLQGGVAPQVFYFEPDGLWYRISQWPDGYQTSDDPTDPASWSAKQRFYASEPWIVTANKGNGSWLDFWVICDDAYCYLFSSDDNGHLYRSRTTLESFPRDFDTPVIAMSDPSPGRLFEAANVYSMRGTGLYLLLVEAFDGNSRGRRYFRSWTATALDGDWTPLQAEYETPFASLENVAFEGAAWTRDISHGEMLRSGRDQKLEIDTCNLRFLYQGLDPDAAGDYDRLPWRLGLLTQVP